MEKIILEIPKEDIEEVIELLRSAIYEKPTSNDVWTLLAPFCEEHSNIKFDGREEELLTYSSNSNQKSDANTLLDVVDLNGYTKHCYGYRKITKEHTHWITFYTGTIQMYGYKTDDEEMEKVYDTGMIKIDNEQLQNLINIWLLNYA